MGDKMTYADAEADALLEAEFQIGKVISKSLSIFLRNIVAFTCIAGATMLPFVGLAAARLYGGILNKWTYILIGLPLTLFLMALTTAIILHAAFQHMRGRPIRLVESISCGLSRFLMLLGVMLLYGLGVILGLLLLIVPGIMLMVMWYVAVPVCVVENAGADQGLRRSAALTKGLRWKVFALLLLFYVLNVAGGESLASVARTWGTYWVQIATEVVWQGLSNGFGSVLIAVAYYYLRVAKEGVDVDQIAAVFD
jgi:hypothetical protein